MWSTGLRPGSGRAFDSTPVPGIGETTEEANGRGCDMLGAILVVGVAIVLATFLAAAWVTK